MKDSPNLSLTQIIKNILNTIFDLVGDFRSLISLETRLAGMSLVRILVLALVLISLLTCTWLSILALIFVGLKFLHVNWVISLIIVCLLNISLLITVCLVMLNLKENLLFPATRRQLSKVSENSGNLPYA